eukprot:TRINITY_DN69811_c0_g1_i1.p1 TRINITY_DN69811_c0_g1~~TRINITY_DN69811_c0_g1_i1.p1  ORF type:complete len:512 (-),score=90.46 TRINITY_DN69811_c0_g1_i1:60-1544(-)
MVEVVQDLLDHVTYAGGIGRRRVDAVRGIGVGTLGPGAADCAVLAEDPLNPTGPRIVPMQELMFHEMLDRPFEEKSYRLQLEEFAYRGDKIIAQVDQRLGEIQGMIGHDVLARSRHLPCHLRSVNDELRSAHVLVCRELEEVWRMRFEPFFYPEEGGGGTGGGGGADGHSVADDASGSGTACPGGWLDIDDMFLTGRLLTRYVAELVRLIDLVIAHMPPERIDRARLSSGRPDPQLCAIVATFLERVPWLSASLPADLPERPPQEPPPTGGPSILNQAITCLDRVLTVHMKLLVSDLHRTMYQTFVRICAAYARWKRAFAAERESVLESSRLAALLPPGHIDVSTTSESITGYCNTPRPSTVLGPGRMSTVRGSMMRGSVLVPTYNSDRRRSLGGGWNTSRTSDLETIGTEDSSTNSALKGRKSVRKSVVIRETAQYASQESNLSRMTESSSKPSTEANDDASAVAPGGATMGGIAATKKARDKRATVLFQEMD